MAGDGRAKSRSSTGIAPTGLSTSGSPREEHVKGGGALVPSSRCALQFAAQAAERRMVEDWVKRVDHESFGDVGFSARGVGHHSDGEVFCGESGHLAQRRQVGAPSFAQHSFADVDDRSVLDEVA